jgi:hypothetical protein
MENKYKHSYKLNNFSIDLITEAIKEFLKDKPKKEEIDKKPYVSTYIALTREETLALKDGDICYINSSYGMQKCIYPHLNETHRNLFGKGGANKTIEERRDYGTIYKLREDGK